MNIKRSIYSTLLVLAGLVWQTGASAQGSTAGLAGKYSDKGADTCLFCHDEESDRPAVSTSEIFRTKHAQRGSSHSPFGKGGLQCEACHGPGAEHSIKGAGDKKRNTNSFRADSHLSVQQRNAPCLSCHESLARNAWHVGAHDRGQVACSDCHKVHKERDPVLAKATQSEVCFACHKQQRAEFQKASTHPVSNGRMGCSDCHNAHGNTAGAMLAKPTVNQTCFSCHADKRGPLLWEHAPVAEDCSLCHTSHGSVRTALLNKAAPLLCQQCHSPAGHPSVPRTSAALPGSGGIGSIFTVAGSCSNCHSQVHGSNHPAGHKLMR